MWHSKSNRGAYLGTALTSLPLLTPKTMPLSSTSRSRGDEVSSVSSTAVDVLVGVLAQLEEVSEFIPVPYFKLAVMGLYQTVVRSKVGALHFYSSHFH
jgi:hypothetical protein